VTSEISTTEPLNHEAFSSHSLTVKATDSGGLFTTGIFAVTVNDVLEGLTATGFDASINENELATVLGTVTAIDGDEGDITYSIFNIEHGNLFSINSTTGELKTRGPINYETGSGSYAVEVRVQDSGYETTTALVNVTINDLNEAPSFFGLGIVRFIEENQPPGVVQTFSTNDPDQGDVLRYSIVSESDVGLFSIDVVTGDLSITRSLDYETATSHSVTVAVTDQDGLSASTSFGITVIDMNEGPSNWVGVIDNNWHNAGNWSSAEPVDGDSVIFDGAGTTYPNASYNVGTTALADLALLSGGLNINGGTLVLGANSAISAGASLSVATGGTLTVDSILAVNGTFELSGGILDGNGIIDFETGVLSLLSDYTTGATPTLNFFNVIPFADLGTVTTVVNGPGSFTNTSGQSLSFVNDTVNADLINFGNITIGGRANSFNGSFSNEPGATLNLAGDVAISYYTGAGLTIDQGFVNSGTIVLDDLNPNVDRGASLTVSNGVLTNAGTIHALNSTDSSENSQHTITSSLDNQGLLDIDYDVSYLLEVGSTFTNTGIIDIATGQQLQVPGFSTSTVTLNPGTQIIGGGELNLSSPVINVNYSLDSEAEVIFRGRVNLAFDLNTSQANFSFRGGSVHPATGTLSTITNAVGESLTLDGNVSIYADLFNDGTLYSHAKFYGGFVNTGTLVSEYASIVHAETTSVFTNDGLIVLNQGGNLNVTQSNGTGGGAMVNEGTIHSMGNGGGNTLSASLVNYGLIDVDLDLHISTNRNTFDMSTGTVDIAEEATLEIGGRGNAIYIGPGATQLGAGTLAFTSNSIDVNTLHLSTDVISGAENGWTWDFGSNGRTWIYGDNGVETFTNAATGFLAMRSETFLSVDFINNGALEARGTNKFDRNFTTTNDSVVALSIGGATQGTQYDLLDLNAVANLAGTLSISLLNGYTPTLGASFDIISTTAMPVGTFHTLNGVDVGGGLMLSPTYTATGLTLTVVDPDDVVWTGGVGDGNWHSDGNWDTGAPAENESATLSGAAQYSVGTSNLASLAVTAGGSLDITAGELNLAIASIFNTASSLTLQGGALGGSGNIVIESGASFDWNSGSLTGAGDILVNGTITFGATTLTLDKALTLAGSLATLGSGIIAGSGSISIDSLGAGLNITGGQTVAVDVTNDNVLMVSGTGNTLGGSYTHGSSATLAISAGASGDAELALAQGFRNESVISLDNLAATPGNASLSIATGTLINRGLIQSLDSGNGGGTRYLLAELENRDTLQVENSLVIQRAGANHYNNDTINVDGSTLTFGDHFTQDDGAEINLSNGASLSFDSVALHGYLNVDIVGAVAGDTFNIISWNSRSGNFSEIAGFDLGGGNLLLESSIDATGLTATAVAITNTYGTSSRDVVAGGSGNNTLRGNEGDDFLYGGGGNDWLFGGPGADTLDGGTGSDNAIYSEDPAGVILHLDLNWAQDGYGDIDTLLNILYLTGSNFDDEIYGDSLDNELFGGDGNDILVGGGGYDKVTGGAGADIFVLEKSVNGANLTITDFNPDEDEINLDALFDALGVDDLAAREASIEAYYWQAGNTIFEIATDNTEITYEITVWDAALTVDDLLIMVV